MPNAIVQRSIPIVRWILGTLVVLIVLGLPLLYYRHTYEHSRRLRVVASNDVVLADGRTAHHVILRSGQLTADGFRDAVRRYGIRTVINLQEESRDPLLPASMFDKSRIRQSTLLTELGVKYVPLDGGVLDHPDREPGSRPLVVDQFLAVIQKPENHPILFHCKAGLHRTGLMTAIYRMEYNHRSPAEVIEELKANGFGTFAATDANLYLDRFIMQFTPSTRKPAATPPEEAKP